MDDAGIPSVASDDRSSAQKDKRTQNQRIKVMLCSAIVHGADVKNGLTQEMNDAKTSKLNNQLPLQRQQKRTGNRPKEFMTEENHLKAIRKLSKRSQL